MANETTVTVTGNLVNHPELRFTNNGTAVANFTVANTPRVFRNGEWADGDTLFMRCNVWRAPAENLTNSLTKGDRVVVVGRLKQRSFTKDDETRTVIELDVEEVAASVRYAAVKVSKARPGNGGVAGHQPARGTPRDDEEPPF